MMWSYCVSMDMPRWCDFISSSIRSYLCESSSAKRTGVFFLNEKKATCAHFLMHRRQNLC